MFTARAKVLTQSGPTVYYSSGPSPDRASAISELTAKLALVVGVQIMTASVTEELDIVAAALVLHADTPYEEATLVLQKPGPMVGQVLTKNVTIENVSLDFKVGTAGLAYVDTTLGPITTFTGAYKDGNGVGGYVAIYGLSKFKK